MNNELEYLKQALYENKNMAEILDFLQLNHQQLWNAITDLFYKDTKNAIFEEIPTYFSFFYKLFQQHSTALDERLLLKSILKLQKKVNQFFLQTTDDRKLFQYGNINHQLEALYFSVQTNYDFLRQSLTFYHQVFSLQEYNFIELLVKKNPALVNAVNEAGKPLLYVLLDTYFFYLSQIQEYDGMEEKEIYYHRVIALFLKQKELQLPKDQILEYIINHCEELPIHIQYEIRENLKKMIEQEVYQIPHLNYQRGLQEWLSNMPKQGNHYDFNSVFCITIDTKRAQMMLYPLKF